MENEKGSVFALATTSLTKVFKGHPAVTGIDLNVPKGSIYGLLGPNGAGKSTTLKMITGMLKPTSGSIFINDHEWTRNDLYSIGSLIEQPALYSHLTAFENLQVRALLLSIPQRRINEVLQIVNLTDTGKKKAGQFSLGMKQRLGIALALLPNPGILILDEPTNGLDPMGIEDLRALIHSFAEQGITVIVSSHILAEVSKIADHIGIIADGQLAYEGAIDESTDLEALFMKSVQQIYKGNYKDNSESEVRSDAR